MYGEGRFATPHSAAQVTLEMEQTIQRSLPRLILVCERVNAAKLHK
jgi:hypothetical protein